MKPCTTFILLSVSINPFCLIILGKMNSYLEESYSYGKALFSFVNYDDCIEFCIFFIGFKYHKKTRKIKRIK